MQTIIELANEFWNLWLVLMFVAILAWSLWPSKERAKEMKHAANIPFQDGDSNAGKGDL